MRYLRVRGGGSGGFTLCQLRLSLMPARVPIPIFPPGPGMARSVSGGGAPPPPRAPEDHFNPLRRNDLQDPPLSVGASAPPPVRDQGPGRSLPGSDAGHPLQGAGQSRREKLDVPVACPIGRSTPGTGGHSRTDRYTGSPADRQADPLRKPTFQAGGQRRPRSEHDSHAPCLAGSFVIRMTIKVTTNLGQASTAVEGPHGP